MPGLLPLTPWDVDRGVAGHRHPRASGLPVRADLEYGDEVTLGRVLAGAMCSARHPPARRLHEGQDGAGIARGHAVEIHSDVASRRWPGAESGEAGLR